MQTYKGKLIYTFVLAVVLFFIASLAHSQTYIKGPALIETPAVVATAAGTTTLTSASQTNQIFTGSSTQSVVLPDATTLSLGRRFRVENTSSGSVTLKDGGSNTLYTLVTSQAVEVVLSAAGSAAGTWVIQSAFVNLTDTAQYVGILPASRGGGGGLTTGSIPFSNGSILSQNNANLFWDNSSTFLGINTATPDAALTFGAFSAGTSGRSIHYTDVTATTGASSIPKAFLVIGSSAATGGTDKNGGGLTLQPGAGTGAGSGGTITFQTSSPGSTGTSLNSVAQVAKVGYFGIITGTGSANATTATDPYLYLTSSAGVPTGVPSALASGAAITVDSTNHQLYFDDGSWHKVGTGDGTVTSVSTNAGLTGGTITSSGTIGLAQVADKRILANISGSSAVPTANSLSGIIDNIISSTQGSVLFRNSAGWVALAPGSNTNVLTSGGAAADISWTAPTTGTVTSVSTNNGLTGGAITSTGTIGLSQIAGKGILANTSGSSAVPSSSTLSAILDASVSSTQGDMLFRNSAGWIALANPATAGKLIRSGGTGGDPSYSSLTLQSGAGSSPAALVVNSGSAITTLTGSAHQVLKITSSTILWAQADLAADVTGILPVANGGTNTSTAFTTGSVVFAGASGTYTQDNASLFFDDTNNKLLIGSATDYSTNGETFQIAKAANIGGGEIAVFSSTASHSPILSMNRSKGNTLGTQTIVASGDKLGNLNFAGSDGTAFISAANIIAKVDGSPGINNMPGRLEFYTTAASASSGTEWARLSNTGNFSFGDQNQPPGPLIINNTSTANNTAEIRNFSTSASSDGVYGLRITKGSTTTTSSQSFILFDINAGGSHSGKIVANGADAAQFASTSDRRVKENIQDLPSQLPEIMALRPVEFDYRDMPQYGIAPGHQIGFVAQDMLKVYPDSVMMNKDGLYEIAGWSKTDSRLVKAIQEMQAEIDDLKKQLKAVSK